MNRSKLYGLLAQSLRGHRIRIDSSICLSYVVETTVILILQYEHKLRSGKRTQMHIIREYIAYTLLSDLHVGVQYVVDTYVIVDVIKVLVIFKLFDRNHKNIAIVISHQ